MATNVYEGMFILDANRYTREPDTVSGQIPQMIQAAGGEILVSRMWEERRLAFTIKGHRKGAYWLTYFRLDPAKLTEVRRKCQLSDSILRVLLLRVDPRIVDTLVAHALAGPTAATPDTGPDRGFDRGSDRGSERRGRRKAEAVSPKDEGAETVGEEGEAELAKHAEHEG